MGVKETSLMSNEWARLAIKDKAISSPRPRLATTGTETAAPRVVSLSHQRHNGGDSTFWKSLSQETKVIGRAYFDVSLCTPTCTVLHAVIRCVDVTQRCSIVMKKVTEFVYVKFKFTLCCQEE